MDSRNEMSDVPLTTVVSTPTSNTTTNANSNSNRVPSNANYPDNSNEKDAADTLIPMIPSNATTGQVII